MQSKRKLRRVYSQNFQGSFLGFDRPLPTPTQAAQRLMQRHNGKMIVADIWPFLPTIFNGSPSAAWPHESNRPNGPLLVYFLWEGEENDYVWINQMKEALERIHAVALEEKCTTEDAPVHLNTSLSETTSVKAIYRGNLPRLSRVRRAFDPKDIMSNTGGFRIPLFLAEDDRLKGDLVEDDD